MTLEAALKSEYSPEVKLGWQSLYKQTDAIIANYVFTQGGEEDESLTPERIELI